MCVLFFPIFTGFFFNGDLRFFLLFFFFRSLFASFFSYVVDDAFFLLVGTFLKDFLLCRR